MLYTGRRPYIVKRRGGSRAGPLSENSLPAVLVWCVGVVGRSGRRATGVFRVSAARAAVAALRAAADGPAGLRSPPGPAHRHDVHAAAGLLKLWLRELRPPLLPPSFRPRLLSLAATPSRWEEGARALIGELPVSHMISLRYLCGFLAHLASHSASTMMDAWNLAICLGPTLLAAGGEVSAQNLLNDLLKRLIERHEDVFPQHVAPHLLYSPPPSTSVSLFYILIVISTGSLRSGICEVPLQTE